MKTAVFTIKDHSDITKAINFMHTNYTQAINEGKPLRVVIDQKQDDRSTAQNRLMWMWLGQIERKIGQDKDSLHYEFKKKFLIYIYRRDDQEFAETCNAIAMLKQNECEEYRVIAEQVIRLCSTTKLSIKQMTEYLNYVHDFAVVKLGIHLTVPDDLKWCYQE
ncbi:recombination protein NinB [Acinetobacter lwoffii]|uniref:recombination protein NinB n=1 Tax=Acinetobacter lwoffii TaxID=28090 RepID=UPI002DBB4373|nr:recombination protein NinB [Acinetobacter lwoffii]MEB6679872.1 recombination protein NinB [Acinetobacter lwoffii]